MTRTVADDGQSRVVASVHEPLLGTRVVLRLRASDADVAARCEQRIVEEMDRLEAVLSAYRADSEWSRWRRGELETAGPEITALMTLAAQWHERSGGAFNPAVGALRARWLRAVEEQQEPQPSELAVLAAAIDVLPYRVTGDVVERTGDCSQLDLHAIAKGWIVDRAVDDADLTGVTEVLLNAGGDLLHRGPHVVAVGIEDPRRPFDNEPPMAFVQLSNGGLATSSGARRPLRIAHHRHSHVLDPRTGMPVEHVLSATVLAPDVATADAVATVVGVLPVEEGLAFAEALAGVECCLLTAAGDLVTTSAWPARTP